MIKNNLFVLLILFFMAIPGLLFLLGQKQIFAINENRVLSSWPEGNITKCLTDDGTYAAAISDYFNDRFGFRDLMIRTKNEIQYRLFNVTGENGLYVGEDAYLFYKSVVEIEQIANEQMSDSDYDNIFSSLCKVHNYLENKGIHFLFMFPPQKNEVFPERLPVTNVNRPQKNAYLKVCDVIKNNEILKDDFIDTLIILREAEKFYPTYYKTDFHWNGYGATQAFTPIVNILAEREGIVTSIFDMDKYEVYTQDNFKGGQLNNLPLIEQWSETAYFTRKKGECTSTVREDDELPNKAVHWINSDGNAPLGTVLFIGESYTEGMVYSGSGILDNFKEAYWVHLNNSENVLENYENIVDYVVFERIESGIFNVTSYIDSLSDLGKSRKITP